ncbi:hypothetical protein [Actinotalea sp. JY-7876]|uniref:hypothetical protein n=1 Tax=Actinotalea sp. JY-7876 TaxID=2758442 RepID=UPI0015F67633|nr:hypothetical protein [Actinotalea sp. JY-7876]
MPDAQRLEVTGGGKRATVAYAQRGTEGWYELRDGEGHVLADVEVDLTWPGDRARGVRRVLAAIEAHQAAGRG